MTDSPSPSPHPIFAYLRRIPPHKILLGIILACSVLFFFVILAAGAFALMREGSVRGHTGMLSLVGAIKRVIVRHLSHGGHHR